MKNLRIPFFLFFLMAVIAGCNKENLKTTTILNTSYEGVTMKDGRVQFNSFDTYKSFIKLLFDNQGDELFLSNVIPDFKSIAEVYKENLAYIDSMPDLAIAELEKLKGIIVLKEGNGENSFERKVDLILLSYIVNENGEMQIADNVYKMNYDNIVWCNENYFNTHPNDMNSLLSSTDAGIEKHVIERSELGGSRTETDDECFYYMTPTTPNNTRLRGRMRHTNAFVYVEVKLISAHERKEGSNWNLFTAKELRVQGTGYFKYTTDGVPHTDPYSVNNISFDDKELNVILFSAGGTGEYTNVGFSAGCSNTHTVKRYTGSMYVTCNTTY